MSCCLENLETLRIQHLINLMHLIITDHFHFAQNVFLLLLLLFGGGGYFPQSVLNQNM